MLNNPKFPSNSSSDKVIELVFSPDASLCLMSAIRLLASVSPKSAIAHSRAAFRAEKRITRSFHRDVIIHSEIPKFNSFILIIVNGLRTISVLNPYRFINRHSKPPFNRRNNADHCSYELNHKGVDHIVSPVSMFLCFAAIALLAGEIFSTQKT